MKIIIIVLLLFSAFQLQAQEIKNNAQEKKQSIGLNAILSHYMKPAGSNLGLEHGYYFYPIDPGLEVLYKRKLDNKLVFGFGINYQLGRNASNVSGPRRFKFHEFSVPVILQKELNLNGKNWYLTAGIYGGKIMKVIAEHPDKYWEWREWSDYNTLEFYSDDEIFMDIYLDVQKEIFSWQNSRLLVSPYTSFRINSSWLTNYQRNIHYGLKINYELKV